jgi:hypothetical protein
VIYQSKWTAKIRKIAVSEMEIHAAAAKKIARKGEFCI